MHPLESREPQVLCCPETDFQTPQASSGFLSGFLPHLPFLALSPHSLHAGTDSADTFPSSSSFGRGNWNFLSSVELFLVSNNVVCALAPEKFGLSLVEGADVGAGPSSP